MPFSPDRLYNACTVDGQFHSWDDQSDKCILNTFYLEVSETIEEVIADYECCKAAPTVLTSPSLFMTDEDTQQMNRRLLLACYDDTTLTWNTSTNMCTRYTADDYGQGMIEVEITHDEDPDDCCEIGERYSD